MYDHVFRQITLANVSLRNRIVRTAHDTGLAGEDLIRYHEERAKGGVALSILELAGVHPSSATPRLPLTDDTIVAFYEQLHERMEPLGMRVFQQLWHGGSAVLDRSCGTPWSASAVPNPVVGVVPLEMTKAMIDDVVASYAAAAGRVQRGGLDGLEIHSAHTYLPHQFLSPALNKREDEYGGSPENRLRFLREVLAAVRSQVGPDFPVGVRMSGEDFVPGGLGPADVLQIAQSIDDSIDFLNLSIGSYWKFNKMVGSMEEPLGYEIPYNTDIARGTKAPVILTGRIMTLDHADRILESGAADMVSMVRALIADPALVLKAKAGRDAEIRPCIGTNLGCLGNLGTVGRIGCVVNVAAGREAGTTFEPQDQTGRGRRVLVIGGGPAGLEAARTAALRGYEVELHELRRELGGQVDIASRATHRADIAAITRWLQDELIRLGVRIRRGSFVDPDLVEQLAPDAVILATGSMPTRETPQAFDPARPIPGAALPHVYTSWEALGEGRRAALGERVVIFDDTGTLEAITTALAAVEKGAAVTIVSSHPQLGSRIPYQEVTIASSLEVLSAAGYEFIGSARLVAISANSVEVASLTGYQQRSLPANSVVLVTYPRPNRELADELNRRGIAFRTVGAVNGTQELQVAIREGAQAGRDLDVTVLTPR